MTWCTPRAFEVPSIASRLGNPKLRGLLSVPDCTAQWSSYRRPFLLLYFKQAHLSFMSSTPKLAHTGSLMQLFHSQVAPSGRYEHAAQAEPAVFKALQLVLHHSLERRHSLALLCPTMN